ncbi:hypothetical protein OC845_004073 [Tilletia horrida]|nr:hypothetical protein OC845_004073 [Tilletia horrida]
MALQAQSGQAQAQREVATTSSSATAAPAEVPPLIPLTLVDAPAQRYYATAGFIAVQSFKIYHVASQWWSTSSTSSVRSQLPRTIFIDASLLYLLYTLKIPRLSPPLRSWLSLLLALTFFDLLLTGWVHGILLAALAGVGRAFLHLFVSEGFFSGQLGLTERQVRVRDLISPSSHIFGQHTIHILPHSTAKFRIAGQSASSCYCVGPAQPRITIPITFNNTEPVQLQYSVTSFSNSSDTRVYNVEIPRSALISTISRVDKGSGGAAAGDGAGGTDSDADAQRQLLYENDGEIDLDDLELLGLDVSHGAVVRAGDGLRDKIERRSSSRRRTSAESLFSLPIQHVGRIRLERVIDRQQMDARISASEILVVECPTTRFAEVTADANTTGDGQLVASSRNKIVGALTKTAGGSASVSHFCPGDEAQLFVEVRGTAPMSVSYHRQWAARIGEEKLRVPRGHSDFEEHPNQQISRIAPVGLVTPLVASDQAFQSEEWDRQLFGIVQEQALKARSDSSTNLKNFDWASSRDVRIPLNLDLSRAGTYSYELASVRDACGNLHVLQSPDEQSRSKKTANRELRSVEVHQPAKVAFVDCIPERPAKLKRGQNPPELVVKIDAGDAASAPLDLTLSYAPDAAAQEVAGSAWTRNYTVKAHQKTLKMKSTGSGTYTLEKATSKYCSGEIGAPWTCNVVAVPVPYANISFSSIDDICSGPVGVKALAIVTGAPPFSLKGTQISGRNRHPFERTFSHSREEIEFKPSAEGAVEYVFESLSDSNYQNIHLDGPRHKQVVHPLASASFAAPSAGNGSNKSRDGTNHIALHSCTGDTASYDVLLQGTGPFDLTYAVRSNSPKEAQKTITVKDINNPRYHLEVKLPKEVAKRGGEVTVSLVSVKDGKGCERPLTTSDLIVDVRRVKPTAAFFPADASLREVVKLEDHDVELPVRLSGGGPWKVGVQHESDTAPKIYEFNKAESQIKVRRAGLYTLTSVADQCPGDVLQGRETYVVRVRERPAVRFTDQSGLLASNQSLLRRPVCAGTADAAEVTVRGQHPVEYSWQQHIPSPGRSHHGYQTDVLQAASAQDVSSFQLLTSTPGWHIYELLEVGDAVYERKALAKDARGAVLEQYVQPLPSAAVQQGKDLSFCVGEALGASTKALPSINLVGTPPFSIDFKITHDSTGKSRTFHRRDVAGHRFNIDIPASEFNFSSTGTWRLSLLKVTDGNGCETLLGEDGQRRSGDLVMEVAETASIAAVGDRDDYCVGESVEFLLQGNPPWMVEYEFNGKKLKASSKEAGFTRIADRPGKLVIQRVAHQRNKCQQDVTGLVKTIHQLPTVRVREGKHFIENLREGNRAEIVFTLTGVPPFSFTYQRTETFDDHVHPKVLETHTVAGILEHHYSIFTSQEGTWSVTFLQDRHCAVDAQGDSPRLLGKAKLAIEAAQ